MFRREREELDRIRSLFQKKLLGLEQRYLHATSATDGSARRSRTQAHNETSSHQTPPPLKESAGERIIHDADSQKQTSTDDAVHHLQQRYDHLSHSQLTPTRDAHSFGRCRGSAASTTSALVGDDLDDDDDEEQSVSIGTSHHHHHHHRRHPLNEEMKRLDRQYEDARAAMRALTSRLARPLPMDAL